MGEDTLAERLVSVCKSALIGVELKAALQQRSAVQVDLQPGRSSSFEVTDIVTNKRYWSKLETGSFPPISALAEEIAQDLNQYQ